MSAQPKRHYTLEEYLELDRNSDERLEYWEGEIFSMSGVSDERDQIEGNLHFLLRLRLAGRNCRAFLANMRIKVPAMYPLCRHIVTAICRRCAARRNLKRSVELIR